MRCSSALAETCASQQETHEQIVAELEAIKGLRAEVTASVVEARSAIAAAQAAADKAAEASAEGGGVIGFITSLIPTTLFSALVQEQVLQVLVIALVVGRFQERYPPGVSFGHSAAMIGSAADTASAKLTMLREAGVHVCGTLDDVAPILERLLPGHRRSAS